MIAKTLISRIRIARTLIATVAFVAAVVATSPAQAKTTVFGDRLAGIANAITGNFSTPEPYAPNSAVMPGLMVTDHLLMAATRTGSKASRSE